MKVVLVSLASLFVIGGILFTLSVAGCRTEDALLMRTSGDIRVLNEAVIRYEKETGYLPTSLADLVGSQLIELKLDVWGADYKYTPKRKASRRVYSLGADGEVRGDGLATDMYLDTDYKKLAESI